MRGCMEDLVAQTIFDQIEVIVIDSGSLQAESSIVSNFAREYPQIKLLRTEREPLYASWNRALELASGNYLTSANTDDRHRPDSFEILADVLDCNPSVGLVYADQLISDVENETFAACEERGAPLRRWPDFTHLDLLLRCITGSQPMWRRCLHGDLGGFDTRYGIAADFDMWLRISAKQSLLHVASTLGVFYHNENTISGKANRRKINLEVLDVQRRHSRETPWRDIKDMPKRLSAEIFGLGYQLVNAGEAKSAVEPFFREAIRLSPLNISYLKTYLVRCVAGIKAR